MGRQSNPSTAAMLFRWDDYLFHLLYAGGTGPLTSAAGVLSVLGGGWSLLALAPLIYRARTRRFAPARRITSPRAQADRRPAGMTPTGIPQRHASCSRQIHSGVASIVP